MHLRTPSRLCAALLFFCGSHMSAQLQQFSTEGEAFLRMTQKTRASFLATSNRTGGIRPQAEFAAGIDLLFRPLNSTHGSDKRDPDTERSNAFRLGSAYHYLPASNIVAENRLSLDFAARRPILSRITFADRSRGEFRWVAGTPSWRYRNLLTMERPLPLQHHLVITYLSEESYRDSRYSKWNETALTGGAICRLNKRFQLDAFYEHDHQTGSGGSPHVNRYSLKLDLFLPHRRFN